jgi:uridine phosphorylase
MKASELILNPDGSIYHLHLLPGDLAPLVILVGDQDRVPLVSKYFDRIEIRKSKREFITHTGWMGDKRITVLSTGIGTDNIDIVMNELDALVNVDLDQRQIKPELTQLKIARIGTSGSIHPDIEVGEIVVSGIAVGTDTLGQYYDAARISHPLLPDWAYVSRRHDFDLSGFRLPFKEGITITSPGFYGPQRRMIRLHTTYSIPIDGLHNADLEGLSFTNLEMETAGIYLLSEKLGHQAISFNAILAKRHSGVFANQPERMIDDLIKAVLNWIINV